MALGGFDNLTRNVQDLLGIGGAIVTPGTSLEISEADLDGTRKAGGIRINLRGRAMPYREPSFPVTQHIKTTWYPGNPVATQQVLGPREGTTTFEGEWKDRFLRDTVEVEGLDGVVDTAPGLSRVFEDLCRRGTFLRVQWLDTVRTGVLIRFEPSPKRATDWPWEMEFEWSARDDQTVKRAATEASDANDGFGFLNDLLNAIAAIPDIIDTANSFVALTVGLVDDIANVAEDLLNALQLVETLVNFPGTLIGAIKNAVARLSRLVDEFVRRIGGPRTTAFTGSSGEPDFTTSQEVTSSKRSPVSRSAGNVGSRSAAGQAPPADGITNRIKVETWRKNAIRAAKELQAFALAAQDGVVRRATPPTQQVVTVPEGGSLYTLSTQIYGSPDFAGFLAQANQLPNANVPPGFELRAPPRPVGAAQFRQPQQSSSTGGLQAPPGGVGCRPCE